LCARHRRPSLPHKARDSGALHLAVPEAWLQAARSQAFSHRDGARRAFRGARRPFAPCTCGGGRSLLGDAGVELGHRVQKRAPRRAAAGARRLCPEAAAWLRTQACPCTRTALLRCLVHTDRALQACNMCCVGSAAQGTLRARRFLHGGPLCGCDGDEPQRGASLKHVASAQGRGAVRPVGCHGHAADLQAAWRRFAITVAGSAVTVAVGDAACYTPATVPYGVSRSGRLLESPSDVPSVARDSGPDGLFCSRHRNGGHRLACATSYAIRACGAMPWMYIGFSVV
jgi:hypothetical protein